MAVYVDTAANILFSDKRAELLLIAFQLNLDVIDMYSAQGVHWFELVDEDERRGALSIMDQAQRIEYVTERNFAEWMNARKGRGLEGER